MPGRADEAREVEGERHSPVEQEGQGDDGGGADAGVGDVDFGLLRVLSGRRGGEEAVGPWLGGWEGRGQGKDVG